MLAGLALVAIGLVLLYFGVEATLHGGEPSADEVPLRHFLRRTGPQGLFSSWRQADLSLRGIYSLLVGALALTSGLVTIVHSMVT